MDDNKYIGAELSKEFLNILNKLDATDQGIIQNYISFRLYEKGMESAKNTSDIIKNLQDRNEELNSKVVSYSDRITFLEKRNAAWSLEFEKIDKENKELKDKNYNLQKYSDGLKKENLELQHKFNSACALGDTRGERIAELMSENQLLTERNKNLEEKIASKKQEMNKLWGAKLFDDDVTTGWYGPLRSGEPKVEVAMKPLLSWNHGPDDKALGHAYTRFDALKSYIIADVDATRECYEKLYKERVENKKHPQIQKVIFNGPCTIVFWKDNTKTIVRCNKRDTFDREKAIAMAFMKKSFGNGGNYYDEIKKYLDIPKAKKKV